MNCGVHFSCFRWETPFWLNLDKKVRIVSFSWRLVPRPIRINKIQWSSSLFLFETGNTFFAQIWSKKSQSHNSMVVFSFCILDGKKLFLASLVQNIKIVILSWNLVPRLINNLNMQNSMMLFARSVLDWKHSFWESFVQKLSIVRLNWNLVPMLFPICKIQWCCSLFLF